MSLFLYSRGIENEIGDSPFRCTLMANGLSDFRSTYGEERTVLASEKAIGRLGEVFVLAGMGSRLPAG